MKERERGNGKEEGAGEREKECWGFGGEREGQRKRENIPKPAFSCFPQLRGYWCHTDK